MVHVLYNRGVHLPEAGLWLDAADAVGAAFVSHAHSDHTARHRLVMATPATLRLMAARLGTWDGEAVALPFGETHVSERFRMRLFPAGHVLGSAQALIECEGGSVLYTGDFKLRPGWTSERTESPHAETLVMETTFGLPRYVFPPADEVLARLRAFCLEALEDGQTPVLLAYSLGKAQELIAALGSEGIPLMLHPSVERITEIYRAEGVVLPTTLPWEPRGGAVLIAPPSIAGTSVLARVPRRRVAVVTGWAMDSQILHRMRCDAAFPLSDHAGFDDLLRHVEAVQPSRVLTLHGFASEFAAELRARGIEAWALTAPNQLELCLPRQTSPPRPLARPTEPESLDGLAGLAAVAARVAAHPGRNAKRATVAEYLASLPPDEVGLAARWLAGGVFPAGEERSHGAGSTLIRRALRLASGLGEADFRAISRRWNDSGETAAEAMRERSGGENPTLPDLARFFVALRAARGPAPKIDLLAGLFRRIPAFSTRCVVKILTGALRAGLGDGVVEDALAAEAGADAVRRAHMLTGDIGEVALLARKGSLHEASLRLFRPLKCMLATPAPTATAVWEHFGGEMLIEDKFDGIRAQIHAKPGRAEIFSRDLHSLTATFPELAQTASQTHREWVLDGEILAWGDGRPAGFFELQKRLGRKGDDLFLGAERPVVFIAFDLLHLDGATLLDYPLAERRARLEGLGLSGNLRVAVLRTVDSAKAIDAAFDEARAAGNEGLVAKDPRSPYSPGRRGGAWVKLKKRHATLDVVVTAVEFGHGRRRGVLSDYTFAVRDAAGGLAVIGKAYSGLTDVEIADLTAHFLTREISRTGNRIEVVPDIVLEIAFDAIRRSSRHASGLALRFPRIERIRADKSVAEIDTLESAARLIAS